MKLPKRNLFLLSVLFNLSMIFFPCCNSKENAELKNVSYFIDTTKHPQQMKNNPIASDTLKSQFKKPKIRTTFLLLLTLKMLRLKILFSLLKMAKIYFLKTIR